MDATHGCEHNAGVVGITDDKTRLNVANFLMEFDTDIAPIVGQQITLSASHQTADVIARIDLLAARAKAAFTSKVLGGEVTDCDLIATGQVSGEAHNYLFIPTESLFQADVKGSAPLSMTDLRKLAITDNNALTFTCVPPGSGNRMALDRDLDGTFNRDPL